MLIDENINDVILKLNNITNYLLLGKQKIKIDLDVDSIEYENLKSLAKNILTMTQQYMECHGFMVDLSFGRLYSEAPRGNVFANPFKQLQSELRHLTWQIKEIANGDYDQSVSFSGDFSDAINKMIIALRERQCLAERIKENENLFRSIFNTSPDSIILCDLCHYIVQASNKAYSLFKTNEDINGKIHYDDFIHHEDIGTFKWMIRSIFIENSITSSAEMRIVTQDKTVIWTEQNASMLLDSNSELKGYIIVVRDISERKAAEAKLLQYMDEVNESNRTKDKLFSVISHDLKSPFSALLGTSNAMAQEIEQDNLNIEKIRKYSKILNDSANRTFSLLINLLEWAKLQADRIEMKPERLNLNEVILENIDIASTSALNKNITLKFDTPGKHTIVNDRAIINTILRNLISNAIKYTPKNGQIEICLIRQEELYMISVKDNGIGIPEDKLKFMFNSNVTGSTPGTANEKGTGLGLGLCKEFVNKIGCDIWVESVVGQGSTFSFTLRDIL